MSKEGLLRNSDRYQWERLTGRKWHLMSDAEFTVFLEGRVTQWRKALPGTCSLPAFLGMTREEHGDWVLTGRAASRVRRVWIGDHRG